MSTKTDPKTSPHLEICILDIPGIPGFSEIQDFQETLDVPEIQDFEEILNMHCRILPGPDGGTDGRKDWTDGRTDGLDGRTDGLTGRTDGRTGRTDWTDGLADR